MNAIEELREIAERIYDGSSGSVRDSQRMLEIACSIEETSQLDRIEARQTFDYQSMDTRLTQLVLNTSAQLSDIEAKLDRLLNETPQEQLERVRAMRPEQA